MGNAQIKLIFPGHDLPFTVPYQHHGELTNKIDKILHDLGPRTQLQQVKWILVDTKDLELLHSSCLAKIKPDRTYLLLDVNDAGEAGERVKRLAGAEAPPPGYDAGAAGAGVTRKR